MPFDLRVFPHVGIGSLRFGADQEEVQRWVEKPRIDPKPPEGWICWKYDHLGVELTFDLELAGRLIRIDSQNPSSTLDGHVLVGLRAADALDIAKRVGLGDYHWEDNGVNCEAEFEEMNLSLWFVDGVSSRVSWGIRFADDGNTPLWPLRPV